MSELELLTTRLEAWTAQRRTRAFAEDGMDIDARLETLEGENRRIKTLGIVAIVFASVLFISGQAKTNKIVEANEFALRVVTYLGNENHN